MPVLTVTSLNTYVKSKLEEDPNLEDIALQAEISNYKHHSSGHRYMTLKDSMSSINAVMFAGDASRLRFPVEDGMKVIVRGNISLYPKTGSYQFYIRELRPDGIGALAVAFEKLKKKLESEGLFAPEHKKLLPFLPEKIGIITSDTGAAVQDIIRILRRRYPVGELILCPVSVQGVRAAPELTEAVKKFDRLKCVDVIIIGRGGGSAEDLWAFNDEQLARAIYECSIPIVSGVGHETDTTICDFVADMRASTPSAAAELISPEEGALEYTFSTYYNRIISLYKNRINIEKKRIEELQHTLILKNPRAMIKEKKLHLKYLSSSLFSSYQGIINNKKKMLSDSALKLDALSPLRVLARGYSVTVKDGNVISSVDNVSVGDRLDIRLSDGQLECTIEERVKYNAKDRI